MGTYTTNYNLFMPTVGEQGWGDLVNGNFSTLDSTIKGLDTRTTALETADIAFDTKVAALENKLGMGTYIENGTIPIYAKLSTVDQGYGWVINGKSYRHLNGFSIVNSNETHSITLNFKWSSNSDGETIIVYGINVATGNTRTIRTIGGGGWGQTSTITITPYITEAISFGTLYDASVTITAPIIYINSAN